MGSGRDRATRGDAAAHPSIDRRYVAVAVILLVVGAFGLGVGGHDVFVAHGLASRLFGAMLAIAGLIMAVAAAGVVRGAPWHVAFSLVGSFAALLVGVALLLAQWEATGWGGRLLIWLAVVVAALGAFFLSLGPGAPEVSRAVRRVQLVAVGGLVIGIGQFVFTSVYGPTPSGPHLTVTTSLEALGEPSATTSLVPIKARITLENGSERKLVVVDSVYRVARQRLVAEPETDEEFAAEMARAAASPAPGLSRVAALRGFVETNGDVVRVGQIVERGFWFEPGESMTREFVLHVRREQYHLLRLAAEVTITESGRLDLDVTPAYGPKRSERNYGGSTYTVVDTRWDVHETSWVRRLIRSENVVWSRWLVDGPIEQLKPITIAYVDEADASYDPWLQPAPARVVELTAEYGVVSTYGSAELSLLADAETATRQPAGSS